MGKYRFEQIAINCTEKKMPTNEDRLTYIGLEHLDTGCLTISRWGSTVPLKGEKLVMRKGDVLLGKEMRICDVRLLLPMMEFSLRMEWYCVPART